MLFVLHEQEESSISLWRWWWSCSLPSKLPEGDTLSPQVVSAKEYSMESPPSELVMKVGSFMEWAGATIQLDRGGPYTVAPRRITLVGMERGVWQFLGFVKLQYPLITDFYELWERADVVLSFLLFLKVGSLHFRV
jgi:hypothetical protein